MAAPPPSLHPARTSPTGSDVDLEVVAAPAAVPPAPARLTTEQRVRRAASLLVLSAVLPGSAQLVAGDRRVGRTALRVWAGLLVALLLVAVLWFADRSLALGLLARPSVLAAAGLLSVLLAVAVPGLLVDAWRLGRPGDLPVTARRWVAGATAVLVIATSVPFVMVGRRLWAAADLVGGVFGGNEAAGTSKGRYNVLLLGGDAGSDRIGLRPDSVTLASVDAGTGRTVLFSLPRNMQNIPFPKGTPAAKALPNGWSCGDACLLNAVYTWGGQHPDLFPGAKDPGAEAMKQAVAGITGLDVSYYVLIDLHGFRALVDAMGGIDLTVKGRVPIGGGTSKVVGHIEPGRQHLDGWHALWYARSRHGSSDYERMQRQRCVMTAMAGQMDPGTLLARFQKVAAASRQVVSTDIPASDLGTFLDLGLEGKQRTITSVQFVPPIVTPSHPDFALVRSRVAAAVAAAEADDKAFAKAGGASAAPGPAKSAPKPSKAASAAPGAAATPRSPSAPGTDTAASGTDVSSVCAA
ncbi:LCP family protein [Kineosporia sp. A_224]|uniref:LCP family protein n=1 Tax=Kineosporia sp. A_224 TaxID=1962180 RepID=UPI000B4BC0A4|nr:LCP family protein [Kineosporia sp. A_224]